MPSKKSRKRRYIEGLQPLHLYPMTVVRVMVKHGQVWAENKKIAEHIQFVASGAVPAGTMYVADARYLKKKM